MSAKPTAAIDQDARREEREDEKQERKAPSALRSEVRLGGGVSAAWRPSAANSRALIYCTMVLRRLTLAAAVRDRLRTRGKPGLRNHLNDGQVVTIAGPKSLHRPVTACPTSNGLAGPIASAAQAIWRAMSVCLARYFLATAGVDLSTVCPSPGIRPLTPRSSSRGLTTSIS
jgi:hypothetical protein